MQFMKPHLNQGSVSHGVVHDLDETAFFFDIRLGDHVIAAAETGAFAALEASLERRQDAGRSGLLEMAAGPWWNARIDIGIGVGALLDALGTSTLLDTVHDRRLVLQTQQPTDALMQRLQRASALMTESTPEPLDVTTARLPIAGLNAGALALALLQLDFFKDCSDGPELSFILAGHGRLAHPGDALRPRARRAGDVLELGYDIDTSLPERAGIESAVAEGFDRYRSAMADGLSPWQAAHR
jgi:hypothetical protein